MNDSIVTKKNKNGEKRAENVLRPKMLTEYIGQEKIKQNLKILIEAAKERKES